MKNSKCKDNTDFNYRNAQTWICCLFPAVMFDIVQQASFLMLFL